MYQEHWGLREAPFTSNLDPGAFFESRVHEEALARLHYLVEQHRRLGIVLGDHGSGKSLLLEVLYQGAKNTGRPVVRLPLVGVSAEELPWQLAAELGLDPDANAGLASLWRSVSDCIRANSMQRRGTMILLDDADEASEEMRQVVSRLIQLDPGSDTQLTVILSAQTDRAASLGARLLELSELRIDLDAWGEEDTAGFLNAALKRVGAERPAFGPSAITRLHQLSGGVPRRVRQLADLALMAGAGQEQQEVDAHTVELVFEELRVGELQELELAAGAAAPAASHL